MRADNKDIIVYKKGGAIGTNKKEVEINNAQSEHYSGKHNFDDVEKLIINPKEVLEGIKKKLTVTEWFVLNKLTKK